MTLCSETILSNIVAIRAYLSTTTSIPVPPGVVLRRLAADSCTFTTPILHAAQSITDTDATISLTLSDAPSLHTTNARSITGDIYTHELSLSTLDRTTAAQISTALSTQDFHLLLSHSDGFSSLLYALPATSTADLDLTDTSAPTVSLKLSLKSLSPAIQLT